MGLRTTFAPETFTHYFPDDGHNHSAKADYGSRRGNRQLELTVMLMALVYYSTIQ